MYLYLFIYIFSMNQKSEEKSDLIKKAMGNLKEDEKAEIGVVSRPRTEEDLRPGIMYLTNLILGSS